MLRHVNVWISHLHDCGKRATEDERNAWIFSIRHPESAWISQGDYEPLRLICLGFLSKYLLT